MQRDGFMVSLTHMLRMPSIFRASSPRGEATCWLEAPMHMKWKLLFLNGLFWFTVGCSQHLHSRLHADTA
jgi:hypothetical protein